MTTTTGILGNSLGVQIITAPNATEQVWRFPESKHRSRRLHKKLTRRLGDQTYRRPAAYMMAGKMYAHPDLIEALVNDKNIVRLP